MKIYPRKNDPLISANPPPATPIVEPRLKHMLYLLHSIKFIASIFLFNTLSLFTYICSEPLPSNKGGRPRSSNKAPRRRKKKDTMTVAKDG